MDQKNTPPMHFLAAVAVRLAKAWKWRRREKLRFADMRAAAAQVDFPATTGSFRPFVK
jgi:hypothetical protein